MKPKQRLIGKQSLEWLSVFVHYWWIWLAVLVIVFAPMTLKHTRWPGAAAHLYFVAPAHALVGLAILVIVVTVIFRALNPPAESRTGSLEYSHSPRSIERSIRASLREHNGDLALRILSALSIGLLTGIVLYLVAYAMASVPIYAAGYISNAPLPGWLNSKNLAFAFMSICAISAARGTNPLENVNPRYALDSPALITILGTRHPRAGIAVRAQLCIEPFRILFEGIILLRSLRLWSGADVQRASELLPRYSIDRPVEGVFEPAIGLLRVLRYIKPDPAHPSRPSHLLTQKGADVLLAADFEKAISVQGHRAAKQAKAR